MGGRRLGPAPWRAKLNEDDIRLARAANRAGLSVAELARKYEVSASTMWQICNYETWVHVKD